MVKIFSWMAIKGSFFFFFNSFGGQTLGNAVFKKKIWGGIVSS